MGGETSVRAGSVCFVDAECGQDDSILTLRDSFSIPSVSSVKESAPFHVESRDVSEKSDKSDGKVIDIFIGSDDKEKSSDKV